MAEIVGIENFRNIKLSIDGKEVDFDKLNKSRDFNVLDVGSAWELMQTQVVWIEKDCVCFVDDYINEWIVVIVDGNKEMILESNGNKVTCNKETFDKLSSVWQSTDINYVNCRMLVMDALAERNLYKGSKESYEYLDKVNELLKQSEVYHDSNVSVHEVVTERVDKKNNSHVIMFKNSGVTHEEFDEHVKNGDWLAM